MRFPSIFIRRPHPLLNFKNPKRKRLQLKNVMWPSDSRAESKLPKRLEKSKIKKIHTEQTKILLQRDALKKIKLKNKKWWALDVFLKAMGEGVRINIFITVFYRVWGFFCQYFIYNPVVPEGFPFPITCQPGKDHQPFPVSGNSFKKLLYFVLKWRLEH